eukprot:2316450-Prymnesium_polylepis.1
MAPRRLLDMAAGATPWTLGASATILDVVASARPLLRPPVTLTLFALSTVNAHGSSRISANIVPSDTGFSLNAAPSN